jgi:hypothetical protein
VCVLLFFENVVVENFARFFSRVFLFLDFEKPSLQGVWAGSSENEIIIIENVCGIHSFAILAS